MRSLASKALALPIARKMLLGEAAIALALAAASVRFFPGAALDRSLAHKRARPRRSLGSADEIAWAVTVIGRRFPRAMSCLVQALAGQALLRRHGIDCRLRIGARKDPAKGVAAHAWIEQGGRVLLGDREDLATYAPFSDREAGA